MGPEFMVFTGGLVYEQCNSRAYALELCVLSPGIGVTKSFSFFPLFFKFLQTDKQTQVPHVISWSYLTGVTAAQLQQQSNMNTIRRM